MSDLVERAKAFALNAHKDQMHGSVPISQHLEAVSAKVAEKAVIYYDPYYDPLYENDVIEVVIAAAWLHDTVEDTDTEVHHLKKEFGIDVAEIVSDVTDGDGKNRLQRHLNTYYRTRRNDLSILVKMCDRWHNQKRSTEKAERFMRMYHDEYLYFKFALYEPGMFDDFWAELDDQYNKMDAIIKSV
jgi:guanosine-3',5'-bis(diphosphate) 3'-pyrophosphohydrolase